MGVMVDLGVHCFPPATTLGVCRAIWELVSPFLVIRGPPHLFLRCHSIDLMLSRLKWTCFSVAVGPVSKSLIFAVKVCHRSRVGLTLASFRSN